MESRQKPRVKVTPRILKFSQGKNPETDEPDEVQEGEERVLEGQEAEDFLNRMEEQENGPD